MQASQLQECVSRIELLVDDATFACRAYAASPDELRSCLAALDRCSDEAKVAVEQGQDEEGIRAKVEALEHLGDRALRACREGAVLDPRLREAVQQVREEIADLMRQLH